MSVLVYPSTSIQHCDAAVFVKKFGKSAVSEDQFLVTQFAILTRQVVQNIIDARALVLAEKSVELVHMCLLERRQSTSDRDDLREHAQAPHTAHDVRGVDLPARERVL